MRYFKLLKEFKAHNLDLFSFEGLSETDRAGLAAEILVLARFEPNLIKCAIETIKDVIPELPEEVRFDLVRNMCALIEDYHLEDGLNTYSFLNPLLLNALAAEEKFWIAEHLMRQIRPDYVSKAEASIGGLMLIFESLEAPVRRIVLAEILAFSRTRTLPDQLMQTVLLQIFISHHDEKFAMILSCLATMFVNQKDPAYQLLYLGFFEKAFPLLLPLQQKHLLKDLHFLITHSYRTVVNAVTRFYKTTLPMLLPEQRADVASVLMALPNSDHYEDEFHEVISLHAPNQMFRKKIEIGRETQDQEQAEALLPLSFHMRQTTSE